MVAAAIGATLAVCPVLADADGYQALRDLADQHPGREGVWAPEVSGRFGAGLTRALHTCSPANGLSSWTTPSGAGLPARRQV